MGVVIAILFVGALLGFAYMAMWGWDRILTSGMLNQVQPDETIVFKSRATRSNMKFPAILLGPRQGFVAVTNRRLILAFWRTLLPIRAIETIPVDQILEANIFRVIAVSQVQLTIGDKKSLLIPMANRFWPYSQGPSERFVEALRTVSGNRITSVTSGFTDLIRSNVEPKR